MHCYGGIDFNYHALCRMPRRGRAEYAVTCNLAMASPRWTAIAL